MLYVIFLLYCIYKIFVMFNLFLEVVKIVNKIKREFECFCEWFFCFVMCGYGLLYRYGLEICDVIKDI